MNPDEVVAIGAAIQGGVLAGEVQDVLLLDVTPLSLGIETEGGVMTALVERNTTIPTEQKQVFSTAADNQTAVTVRVFQGERKMARDNRLLDQFNLEGIPPAPRGMPQIEVKFDIDVNGILNVSAKDLGTGKEHKISIQNASGLPKEEIEKMQRDAEAHASEDKRKRELAEARNQAESTAFQVEKQLKEHGEKLTDNDKAPLEAAIAKVREAAKGENVDTIKAATSELDAAFQAASKVLYEAASKASPAGDAGAAGAKKDDDAIDAEFEVKE